MILPSIDKAMIPDITCDATSLPKIFSKKREAMSSSVFMISSFDTTLN